MDESWMETACSVSVLLFAAFVGGCLIATMIRALRGGRAAAADRDPSAGRRDGVFRLFLEYVGNIGPEETPLEPFGRDRRQNWQARALMDAIKREMLRRDVTFGETEALLEELRSEMHTEGRGRSGQGC